MAYGACKDLTRGATFNTVSRDEAFEIANNA